MLTTSQSMDLQPCSTTFLSSGQLEGGAVRDNHFQACDWSIVTCDQSWALIGWYCSPNTRIWRCDSLPRALEHNFHDKKVKDGSQQYLLLEEIHCESPVTEEDLGLFVTHCPNVNKLKIVYKPNELQQDVNSPQYPHLSQLSLLKMLTDASIISADFFNHSVFSALQLSGRDVKRILGKCKV